MKDWRAWSAGVTGLVRYALSECAGRECMVLEFEDMYCYRITQGRVVRRLWLQLSTAAAQWHLVRGELHNAKTTSLSIYCSVFPDNLIQRRAKPYELVLDLVRKSSFTSFQPADPDVEDDTLLRTLLRRRCSDRSDGRTSLTTASALVRIFPAPPIPKDRLRSSRLACTDLLPFMIYLLRYRWFTLIKNEDQR